MDSFDSTMSRITTYLREIDGAALLICVCDDPSLASYAIQRLQTEMLSFASYSEFVYSSGKTRPLSSGQFAEPEKKRRVISILGLESLSRDDQSEAIRLLNLERNRIAYSGIAIVFWITSQLLRRIGSEAADFFSWRSATFFIPEPHDWNKREAYLRKYYSINRRRFVDEAHSLLFTAEETDPADWLSLKRSFRTISHLRPTIEGFSSNANYVGLSKVLESKRICIIGASGVGKTTLMQGIALSLIDGTNGNRHDELRVLRGKIPVYVSAGDLSRSPLEREARRAFEAVGDREDELLESLLANGEIILMIDGADEAQDLIRVAEQVRSFAARYSACNVLLTTRVSSDLDLSESDGWKWYSLEPLNDSEIQVALETLLDRGTAGSLLNAFRQKPGLAILARSPELLLITAAVFEQTGELPGNRFALLSLATNLLFMRDRTRSLVGREEIGVSRELQQFLPQVAWIFQQSQVQSMSRRDLTRALMVTKDRTFFNSEELEAFIRNAMHYTSIFHVRELDRDGEPLFSFSHKLLQEYFASVQLVRRWLGLGVNSLSDIENQRNWVSVISLSSAGMNGRDAEKLIDHFMKGRTEAGEQSRLLIAGACVAEGAPLGERTKAAVFLEMIRFYEQQLISLKDQTAPEIGELEETIIRVGITNPQLLGNILAEKEKMFINSDLLEHVLRLFLPLSPKLIDLESLRDKSL